MTLIWLIAMLIVQVLAINQREAKLLDLATRPRQGREDDSFSIARRSCRVAGETGTCMFVWECLKTEGKHLGMCMDGFMFGSCCVHDEDSNKVITTEDTLSNTIGIATATTTQSPVVKFQETSTQVISSQWPTRPSRPTKTPHNHHHLVKWPSFHMEDVDEKIDVESVKVQHFVDVEPPKDPRPTLTTTTRSPFADRKPTNSWSWEKRKSTSTTEATSYFPSSSSSDEVIDGHESRPTRPTRPPKPSSFDLVTYFPPSTLTLKTEPPTTTSTTTTTTTYTTTTSTSTTTARITTTATTTVATTSENRLSFVNRPSQPRSGSCGLPENNGSCAKGRIVNGTQSCYGQFPWQVSVRRTSFFGFSSTHRCGGALINELWVATAGHCVDDLLVPKIRVRIGEWDFSSTTEPQGHIERKIKEKIVHPKYNFFTYEYDLALLKLDKRVDFQNNIIPICLPGNDDLLVGEMGIVAGWGRLNEGGRLPDILQYVSVPIVSNDKCKSMFLRAGRHEVIPEIFMCAGYDLGGRDSCQGDSGGPLVVKGKDGRWFLGGIISWGIGCAEPNLPGVCTRISKFTDWILSIVTS